MYGQQNIKKSYTLYVKHGDLNPKCIFVLILSFVASLIMTTHG